MQKWQTTVVENINIEKGKHVHIDIGGSAPISLHFQASSKDQAEAIMAKLASSKALSTKPPPTDDTQSEGSRSSPRDAKKASVHFSQSSPVIIPDRGLAEDPEEEFENGDRVSEDGPPNGHGHADEVDEVDERGEAATAIYDFAADGEDELTVAEGEQLEIIEKDGDEWWKCRNAKGAEGVVPASYLEVRYCRVGH